MADAVHGCIGGMLVCYDGICAGVYWNVRDGNGVILVKGYSCENRARAFGGQIVDVGNFLVRVDNRYAGYFLFGDFGMDVNPTWRFQTRNTGVVIICYIS